MANGHGGSRVPSDPAPVSGPGALSKRTDGQGVKYMSGGQYGEGHEMVELQSSAPMSKTQSGSAQPRMRQQSAGSAALQQVTPLFAPTERPDEPITAGAPFGPGPGPQMQIQQGTVSNIISRLGVTSESEQLLALAMRLGL